jgi:serine/threonine-protein kinase RsbW
MTECAHASYKSVLVMRSDPRELPRMTQWIIEACAAARIREKTSYAVQLCLDEAVANILQYAAQYAAQHVSQSRAVGPPAAAIAASFERSHSGVVLDIEDDGPAFDPTGVAPPAPAQTLELMPIGGLGIHFIRQYSSRMEYSRGGGRNRLRLTFAAE